MNASPSDPLDRLSAAELRHRLTRLTRLLDVTRSVALEIDLDGILQTVVREACNALECDRATVYQFDPTREELYTRVATTLEISEIRSPISQGITGHVARTQRIANVSDPPSDPRWNADVDRRTGYKTRNILAAPLLSPHDGSLLGVVQVLNKHEGAFGAFDEELIQGFGQHAAVALDRARLVDELRRREAASSSLNIARAIQRDYIPKQMPNVSGYEFSVWCYPQEAVGGDYCDIVSIGDDLIGLVVADVSGHGLGPSLIMASVRAAFRALLLKHAAAPELLELLDRTIAYDLRDGKFVTMVVAELHPRQHRVTFANAGHGPALHYLAAEDRFSPLEATGTPLGVAEEADYPAGPAFTMECGDVLLLCTDGIVEAMDPEGEPFGEARLEEFIRSHRDFTADQIVRHVAEAVEQHIAGRMPADDLTILAVRRSPE